MIGYLEVMDGRPRAGIQRIERTIATGLVDHAPGQRAAHIRFLLAAFDLADDPVGGLAAADAALRTPGTLIWEAEAHRLRAKFLAGVGAPTEDIVSELAHATGCRPPHRCVRPRADDRGHPRRARPHSLTRERHSNAGRNGRGTPGSR